MAHMTLAEDEQGIAYAYNNLGAANERLGNFGQAIEAYEKCLDMKKRISDVRGIAMTLNNIGLIRIYVGDFKSAMESYKKSLEIRYRIGDRSGEAYAYMNLGMCMFEMGEYHTALVYYRKQLELMTSIKDEWGISLAFNNMAETEIVMGDLPTAEGHCGEAITRSQRSGFTDVLVQAKKTKGMMLSRMGHRTEAEECFQSSLELAQANKMAVLAGQTYYELGLARKGWGDHLGATECLKRALDVFEKSRMAPPAKKARNALSNLG